MKDMLSLFMRIIDFTYVLFSISFFSRFIFLYFRNETADKMRLYRHLARYPVALRSFLSSNPNYWCFIPLPWEEALADNIVYLPNASTTNSQLMTMMSHSFTDYQEVAGHLDYVSLPPATYTFSYRQRQNQRQFFERLSHSTSFLTNNSMPYTPLDLYKVSIIAIRK